VNVTTDSNGKMATTAFTVTVSRGSMPGDVDMDGRVSIADVTMLIDVMLGPVLTNYDPCAADVTNDGRISIGDVTMIIDLILANR
jgi:hypothetical protein